MKSHQQADSGTNLDLEQLWSRPGSGMSQKQWLTEVFKHCQYLASWSRVHFLPLGEIVLSLQLNYNRLCVKAQRPYHALVILVCVAMFPTAQTDHTNGGNVPGLNSGRGHLITTRQVNIVVFLCNQSSISFLTSKRFNLLNKYY